MHFNLFSGYLEMLKRNLYTSCLEKEVIFAISFDASAGDRYSRKLRQKSSFKSMSLQDLNEDKLKLQTRPII